MWREKLSLCLLPPGFVSKPESASPVAAVLIPIARNPKTGEDEILLTKRTEKVFTHKGQIGFPGGLWEPQDESLLKTALRETYEEIGLPHDAIQVLGRLEPVLTMQNGILVYPWVGAIPHSYPFVLSTEEVDHILYYSLNSLMNEGLQSVEVEIAGRRIQSVGVEVNGELIWGASARMLLKLKESLQSGESPSR